MKTNNRKSRIIFYTSAIILLLVFVLSSCKEKINIDTFDFNKLDKRTKWDIELIIEDEYHIGDERIEVRIKDNDNLGFSMSDRLFKLELHKNNEWVELEMKDDLFFQTAYILPKPQKDYTGTINWFNFSYLKNKDIEAGRYRLTKVISGKPFTVEFDLLP